MATRAFAIEDGNLATGSIVTSRDKNYSDIDLSFLATPTGDLYKKVDIAAVKQAVKNILMTGYHERPFQAGFGGGLGNMRFENFDEDNEGEIELAIKLAVQTVEPRATVKSVRIIFAPDSNRVNITTTFGIINTGQQVVIETNLSRLR